MSEHIRIDTEKQNTYVFVSHFESDDCRVWLSITQLNASCNVQLSEDQARELIEAIETVLNEEVKQ
jgi:hypothetical protein